MRNVTRLLAVLTLAACNSKAPPGPPAPANSPLAASASSQQPPEAPEPTADLPPAPRAVAASELAGDFACGPFNTKELEKSDQLLLNDRARVHFLPKAVAAGSTESAKLEVQRGGATVFVGAREMFLRGDAFFERRAAKTATFGGGYDPVAIPGRDGKLTIVTGLLREKRTDGEMMALAHGWFLDPNRDVVDVAVFASANAVTDLAQCRLFAEKVLSTVTQGTRMLTWGGGAEVSTKVSYATFAYKLDKDWMLSSSEGIHDFARMHFRKRGVFPKGFTELQMALDSHPGDWASAGAEEGVRPGKLLGLAVGWHLTNDTSSSTGKGAWTVSTDLANGDHAVASLQTASVAERDEAIRFAESIRVTR